MCGIFTISILLLFFSGRAQYVWAETAGKVIGCWTWTRRRWSRRRPRLWAAIIKKSANMKKMSASILRDVLFPPAHLLNTPPFGRKQSKKWLSAVVESIVGLAMIGRPKMMARWRRRKDKKSESRQNLVLKLWSLIWKDVTKQWGVEWGRVALPNRMNFRKKFKQPSTPPPSFSENYIAIFFIMDMVAYMQGGMRAR